MVRTSGKPSRSLLGMLLGLLASVVFTASAGGAVQTQRTLWVVFKGTGSGTAKNFTGSGGTGTIVASWTIAWKLRVDATATTVQCTQLPSCAAAPYAFKVKGTGTISGASDANKNCSAPLAGPKPVMYGPRLEGDTTATSARSISLQTVSPVGAGIVIYTVGSCGVQGGAFLFPNPNRAQARATFGGAAVGGHVDVPLSKPVSGPGSMRGGQGLDVPDWVEWSGKITVKLGGPPPKLELPRPPIRPYGPGRTSSKP